MYASATSTIVKTTAIVFQTSRFICGILIVQNPYCNQMPRPETITSAANPMVKDVRRAAARGGLTRDGLAVAETFHLLEEALRSGRDVPFVLAAESAEQSVGKLRGSKIMILPDPLLQSVSGTETSQGVIALVRPPEWSLDDVFGARPLVVLLDGVQDPGNAGTVVRSAEAFGATGVVFLSGSVSPHNPKTLRASAGSLFRLPYVFGVAAESVRRAGVPLYAAVADGPRKLTDVDLTAPAALIIGNEARGVSPELRSGAIDISIPTAGVESLNAAAAATVLLYEASRQRALRP
jgi:TrmH family RNA methyltransferase